MKATRFMRVPFIVTGYRVTMEEIEQISEWCRGHIIPGDEVLKTKTFIRVPVDRPTNRKQTEAYPGMWILLSEKRQGETVEDSFKVYNDNWVRRNFIVVPREIEEDATVVQLAPVVEPEVEELTNVCCAHDRVGSKVRSLPTQGGHKTTATFRSP